MTFVVVVVVMNTSEYFFLECQQAVLHEICGVLVQIEIQRFRVTGVLSVHVKCMYLKSTLYLIFPDFRTTKSCVFLSLQEEAGVRLYD